MYKFKAKKFIITDYILMLFFLMLNYGSCGLFLGKYSKPFTFIAPFLVVACIIFLNVICRHAKFSETSLLIVLALVFNVLFSCAVEADTSSDNLYLILAIVIAFFLTQTFSAEKLVNVYINTMEVLAVYSLISIYIFLPLTQIGFIKLFPTYYVADRPFLDMYFAMCLNWISAFRNAGFCREPGVYQVFLTIALFFSIEWKSKGKQNIRQIVILLITLLTTFSAIAYIILVFALLFFIKKYSVSAKSTIKTTLLMVIALIAFVYLLSYNEKIRYEFIRTASKWVENGADTSHAVRLSGLVGSIDVFLDSPLWGYGMVNSILEIKERFGYNDVTGTMILGFSAFGISYGLIQNVLLWKACKSARVLKQAVWFVLMFLSISSQNLQLSYVLWSFLFLPLSLNKPKIYGIKNTIK